MSKSKQPKQITPAEEMKFSEQELVETLPIEEKAYEKDLPESQPKRDYLDDLPNQQQQDQKQFSQPMMFNEEGKDNLIENLLKVDWVRIEHIC